MSAINCSCSQISSTRVMFPQTRHFGCQWLLESSPCCSEAVLVVVSQYSMLLLMSLRILKQLNRNGQRTLPCQILLPNLNSSHQAQCAHFLDNVNKMVGNFAVLQNGSEGFMVHPVIGLGKFDKTLKCCCFILSYFSNDLPCQSDLPCCPTTLLKPALSRSWGSMMACNLARSMRECMYLFQNAQQGISLPAITHVLSLSWSGINRRSTGEKYTNPPSHFV